MPHYVCGVLADGGRIVEAAPIVAWAKPKGLSFLQGWVRKKGGTMMFVPEGNRALSRKADS